MLHPTDVEMHLERRKRRREGTAGEQQCLPRVLGGDLGICRGCKGAGRCVAMLSSSSELLGRSRNPMERQAESFKSTDSELELELCCPAPLGRDG